MMLNRHFGLCFFCCLWLLSVNAQQSNRTTIEGEWVTIDDKTGKKKAIIEMYKTGDNYHGKIIEILNPKKQNSVCSACDEEDPRYNQKVQGMVIVSNLVKDGDEWVDGEILDPSEGKVYSCKAWLEDENLIVKGYIGFSFIGRSQTWHPHD